MQLAYEVELGKEAKRKNIRDIAAGVFAKNGFERTTIRGIADEGEISAASIYYYFENKEELLYQILDETMSTGLNLIREIEDDTHGSRHQRFIIRTRKNQTILIVHNIDIAPRVPYKKGKKLLVSGEYLWNSQGGKIHYTHRSTSRKKPGGYIKDLETGKIYD